MVYPGIGLLRLFAASVSGTSIVPGAARQRPSAAVQTYVKRLWQRIAAAADRLSPRLDPKDILSRGHSGSRLDMSEVRLEDGSSSGRTCPGDRLLALPHRIDAELRLGHHVRLVSELTALTALHPLREYLHAQLIRSCSIAAVAPHRPWGRSGGCRKHRQVTADEPLLDAPVRTLTALR